MVGGMKAFRPLFVQNLDLRVGGVRPLQMQVNRHLRELTTIRPHTHGFAQLLLYLTGRGIQVVGADRHPVRAGTVVYLPAGFEETSASRPICMVLDVEWEGGATAAGLQQLTQQDLAEAKAVLGQMMRRHDRGDGSARFRMGGGVLLLMDVILRGLGILRQSSAALPSPVVRAVNRTLTDPASREQDLSTLARRVGYQHDYLNRLLKESTGLTLGQMRGRQRLQQAKRMLLQSASVRDAAVQAGFADPNYFTRWFRKQTGVTPLRWRKRMADQS